MSRARRTQSWRDEGSRQPVKYAEVVVIWFCLAEMATVVVAREVREQGVGLA